MTDSLYTLEAHNFEVIRNMIRRVDSFAIQPDLSNEVRKRASSSPDFCKSDNEILKRFIELIAYSNNARSVNVTQLVNERLFDRVFHGFEVTTVSNLNPEAVISEYWSEVGCIRQKYKIERMIRCARVLADIKVRHRSFMTYLESTGLPTRVTSERELNGFWECFHAIRGHLKNIGLPYFSNVTSLCHLLLYLGYDCAKPDAILMKAATDLGIVPTDAKTPRDAQLTSVVQTIQAYSLCDSSGMRPTVVDLYFLIHGGQTEARNLVRPAFYAE